MNCFRCGKQIGGTGKQWVIPNRMHCYWIHINQCKKPQIIHKYYKKLIEIREEGGMDNTKLIEIGKKYGIL